MVIRDTPLPDKIHPDAILEALFEVRFDALTILTEVLIARLAEHAPWKDWKQRRLPSYEIPSAMREADANLRFAPIFELTGADSKRTVRVGPHVVSYHVFAPYPGWEVFEPELRAAVDELFAKAPELVVRRLGLRYVNALTPNAHGIRSPEDLFLTVSVSGDDQRARMNLNFITPISADSICTVRIATKEFVQGAVPEGPLLLIDVDTATTDQFTAKDAASVKDWARFAHERGKVEFFHLLTPDTLARLAGNPTI
jgi:uncharacterized protein (TIGR04255 family)